MPFDLFEPHLTLKLAISANKGKPNFGEIFKWGSKTQNFMLILNPLEKFHKKSRKKSYKQNKLTSKIDEKK